MKVILAGFNVDLETLKEKRTKNTIFTPESISAAYARISRSPKTVEELRKEARQEIKKARASNKRIIFGMGHHSIAEHAVFNFDIIGISRFAVEYLESYRLCSYTEKSQRYVTLQGDFVIPQELKKSPLKNEFIKTVNIQNNFYKHLFSHISKYHIKQTERSALTRKEYKNLENRAKEDARYILPLATQTQVGATINARNLELMIRRFASAPIDELRMFGEKLYQVTHNLAPSILLFCKANSYDQKTYPAVCKYARKLTLKPSDDDASNYVSLVDYTANADDKILTALLFRTTNKSYVTCYQIIKNMTFRRKIEFFKKVCKYVELYDTMLREFEYADLTYEIILSAAAFGQMKRHRMASLIWQEYNPQLGVTIPQSIREIKEEENFIRIIKTTEKLYKKIEHKYPGIGSYILTNAHRKRLLIKVNLRELYHISRLREDSTAQWDIRNLAQRMSNLARKVMPICTRLLGAKGIYPTLYKKLFGRNPRVKEVPEV